MKKYLELAKNYCEKNKLRFTEPRVNVLTFLLEQKKAIGAYDILEKLSTETHKFNPPTIYRAIDFWREHGFVHKVSSLNSYFACIHEHDVSRVGLVVCQKCYQVSEISLDGRLDEKCSELGFIAQETLLEIKGLCYQCAK